MFYSHHNCPVVNILFINTKSSLAFFLLNKNETSYNNKNNNKKQKQEETERGEEEWRPHSAHKFESKCSVWPAVCLWPISPPTPVPPCPLAGAPSSNTPRKAFLPPPNCSPLASVVGDGEAAEDGQAAAGVEAGRLGAAEAARAQGAAQIAVAVRQRVRGTRGRVEHWRL